MFELDTAYSEEEVIKMSKPAVLPEGEYNFEIISAVGEVQDQFGNMVPLVSKTGNPMMELNLKVWDKDGNVHKIKDWLVHTPNMLFKLRHLCEACGLLELWQNKKIYASNFEGGSGRLILTVQKGSEIPLDKRKPGGDTHYPDRNSVKDYVKPTAAKKETKTTEGFFNDDIPFGQS